MSLKHLRREAERQGWKIEHTGSGHLRFTPPDASKRIVIVSSTASDRRAIHNIIGDLRRSGLRRRARHR